MTCIVLMLCSFVHAEWKQENESRPVFTNPIYKGADPWVIKKGRHYYLCQSEKGRGISVWKSTKLIDRGIKRVIWKAPNKGWNSRQIWAPELHYLQGHWYIYYAASDGKNANHRMGVLESTTDDPQGPYIDKGMLYTGDDIVGKTNNRWAIDGTTLQVSDRLYFIWSGWPDTRDIQYLYIAHMKNPWTISSNRVKICENDTYIWERVAESPHQRGLNEGPQVLKRNGKIFIVYSCSGSWEPTYKLGLLYIDEAADPMDPKNWKKKSQPVFKSTKQVFGVGHASFAKSPDNTEDWIIYHSKTSRSDGWQRVVRTQKFGWIRDGFPDFGSPVPTGKVLPAPSAVGRDRTVGR